MLKQWTRLIQGLRIRQRLQEQYSTKSTKKEHIHDDEKDGDGLRAESPHVRGQLPFFFFLSRRIWDGTHRLLFFSRMNWPIPQVASSLGQIRW